jgi:hypothetical protein
VSSSFDLFYQTIETWLRAGVSLIAEYSFTRNTPLEPLLPLIGLARTVVVHCETSDREAATRFIPRERGRAHLHADQIEAIVRQMETGTFHWEIFEPPELGVPVLRVDTTDGYDPDLRAIVGFCRQRA